MAEPVSYEQIVRELAIKRGLKPWEVALEGQAQVAPAPQPTPQPVPAAPDPMAMAQQRSQLMGSLGQMGNMANPETQMANQGQRPNPGLIQLLMSLMKR